MPVQIGAKTHNFDEPLGLLSDCHRRIEMFLGILEAVGRSIVRAPNHPPDEETRRALDSALRYFRDAAPKHTADEEESLFPRLRKLHSADVDVAMAKMRELEQDHRWAGALHERVEELGRKYLAQGRLPDEEQEEFRANLAKLSDMYKRHIRVEDADLFPLAATVLSRSEKLAIAAEMAKRRAVEVADI